MRASIAEHENKWCLYLPSIIFALNATATFGQLSPFNVVFGRDPNFGLNLLSDNIQQPVHETVAHMLDCQRKAFAMAQKVQKDRTEKSKQKYDDKVSDHKLVAGNVVYRKKFHLTPGENSKLQPKYLGPYLVTEVFPTSSTVTLKHLRTGKFVNHNVSIHHLKRPKSLRSLPACYKDPLSNENSPDTIRDEEANEFDQNLAEESEYLCENDLH